MCKEDQAYKKSPLWNKKRSFQVTDLEGKAKLPAKAIPGWAKARHARQQFSQLRAGRPVEKRRVSLRNPSACLPHPWSQLLCKEAANPQCQAQDYGVEAPVPPAGSALWQMLAINSALRNVTCISYSWPALTQGIPAGITNHKTHFSRYTSYFQKSMENQN